MTTFTEEVDSFPNNVVSVADFSAFGGRKDVVREQEMNVFRGSGGKKEGGGVQGAGFLLIFAPKINRNPSSKTKSTVILRQRRNQP